MDLTDFNINYLNKFLENISKEQKSIFRLEDFNVKLLNYEYNQTNKFLDSLACNSFLQLTRITNHSSLLQITYFQMLLIRHNLK